MATDFITKTCRICGNKFASNSIQRVVCEKPTCREAYRKSRHIRTETLYCEICGGIIKVGSRRRKYCCKECREIGRKKLQEKRDKIRYAIRSAAGLNGISDSVTILKSCGEVFLMREDVKVSKWGVEPGDVVAIIRKKNAEATGCVGEGVGVKV